MLWKTGWQELYRSLGVHKGAFVLMQADFVKAGLSGVQVRTALEALMELVGPEGAIVAPAFTPSLLDPACFDARKQPYEWWEQSRKFVPGFNAEWSMAEVMTEAAFFLEKQGAVRSNHPVYSFFGWGNVPESFQKQPMDFPFDFSSVLAIFQQKKTRNLLIGVDWKDSILLQAMAHEIKMDALHLEKAAMQRGKRQQNLTYLMSKPLDSAWNVLTELAHIQKMEAGSLIMTSVSLYSTPDKTTEIFFRSSRKSSSQP